MVFSEIFRIKGDSMYPLLKDGEIVFLEDANDISRGDIVVFDNGGLVVHRVIKILGDKIITQGDNAYKYDSPITKSDIKGKIRYKLSPNKEKILVDTLRNVSGRCGEELSQDYELIFRYLINQFFKGIYNYVSMITSDDEVLPLGNMRMDLLSQKDKQQIKVISDNSFAKILIKNINFFCNYLSFYDHDGELLKGLAFNLKSIL